MAWLRADAITAALDALPRGASVLEIGIGEGAMGARLAERFAYTGVEADGRAAAAATGRIVPRGGRVLVGAAETVAPRGPFDALCAFEVLEHIEDDAAALGEWRSRLRPSGLLVLSVPAHQDRFGPADVAVGHHRRYERGELASLLERTGFTDIVITTYGFPLGFGLEAVRNRLAARRASTTSDRGHATAGSGRWLQPRRALGVVTWLFTAPFRLVQRPFGRGDLGTGYVVRARRRSDA
jgi:SAM-dependent methyltransferase